MKKLIFVVGLLASAIVNAAPFHFAGNGKADYSIVMPDQPKGFDQQAADDLKNYLGKMTGAEFRIVPESKASGEKLIYVGQTAFAQKQGLDFAKLGAEEWVIRPVGKKLVLSGGYPIGSFYAVWNVLNRLGCYSLTWDQDAVPSYKDLTAEISAEQKKPVFDGRMIWDSFPGTLRRGGADPSVLTAYKLYKLRNGINGRAHRDDSLWLYSAHNISHTPQYHSLSHYVPLKLFKTHPEYFSMDPQGKRFRPRSFAREGSLCMSNPEVAKVALESLRKMIKKDRETLPRDKWPYIYDISTLDNSPYICKCPECTAITKEEGSETGLLLRFINHIAREIRKEYPEIVIRTFGYSSTVNPPTKTMPADNVLIQLADKFTVSDPFRPLTDPINADRIPYFREWRKGAKRLMVWDYWNLGYKGYYKPPRPDTVFNAIQSDLRFFRDLGVTDLFIEAGANAFAPQSFILFSYFAGAQLMLDPEKDTKRLENIYFKYYYGPAAPRLQKLFNDICAGMKIQKNRQSSAIVSHWNYLTPEFMYQTYSDLKKLSGSLPEKSVWRQRVDAERIVFIWYVIAKRDSYRKIFQQNGVNIDDLIPECRTLVKAYIRRYPCSKTEVLDKEFEELFKAAVLNLPRPEKFKDVPPENFRMIAYPHFRGVAKLGSKVVVDPDSVMGKALRSANPNPIYHGVDKVLPGKNKFRTTEFKWGNHKASGKVSLRLKSVPQDEKYHWYRIPGKLELKPVSYFVGQGWAIQANTSQLFTLTDGNPLDNTWDEVWFSAKFTGPAYVKGSTKPNAIYVDMAVLVRGKY